MSWNNRNMHNHVCGFAVAAQRRSAELKAAKESWLWTARAMFNGDVSGGRFTGTQTEWQTFENRKRVDQRAGFGDVFTEKQFKAMKWQNKVSEQIKLAKTFKIGQSVKVVVDQGHWCREWNDNTGTIVDIRKRDGALIIEAGFDKKLFSSWLPEQDEPAFTTIVKERKRLAIAPAEVELQS